MPTYVNQGTDKRVGGAVGKVAASTQRALSFRSTSEPKVAKLPLPKGGHIALAWPPFFSMFVPTGNGRYASVRFGWRWDANWGDGNNPTEMPVEHPGGYIADVIVKGKIDHVVEPK